MGGGRESCKDSRAPFLDGASGSSPDISGPQVSLLGDHPHLWDLLHPREDDLGFLGLQILCHQKD